MHLTGIQGRTAVVTGAAGVLCSGIVATLLESGARVALIGRTRETLAVLAETFAAKGLDATLVLPCDVLDPDALFRAREAIHRHFGPVTLLVNGAGGGHPSASTRVEFVDPNDTNPEDTIFGIGPDAFDRLFDLNFKGTLLPSMEFGRDMLEHGGSIVNVSSMGAQFPLTRQVAYSAAKAAVENFTKWLAIHFARTGIRVNAIAPGFFATEQNRFLLFEQDGITLSARGEKIMRSTPMARFGKPSEIAGVVAFLLSEQASFMTGAVVPIDGGYSAYGGV
jgi:NAD(P)-dependent dehydrogenase (short-subunit alcohol dehydrogenase family)